MERAVGHNEYIRPSSVQEVPEDQLDLRPDADVDHDIKNPDSVVADEKNIWGFWGTGYDSMHDSMKRNVRGWHRRFFRQGWKIRILDSVPGSASHVSRFLSIDDHTVLPEAFRQGLTISIFPDQSLSDLVRFPLLVKYGGVYADVTALIVGDLDRMWHEQIANAASPIEVVAFGPEDPSRYSIMNYFFMSNRQNVFFERCHRLFMKLWEDRTSVEGMASDKLVKSAPLLKSEAVFEIDGRMMTPDELSRLISDYVVQTQIMTLVMGLVDSEDGWHGPDYVKKHLYRIDPAEGSLLCNFMTNWDGKRAFHLLSLSLPAHGEPVTEDQKKARELVQALLSKSFIIKLYNSMIKKMLGDTLASLWCMHDGSDDKPNTYAYYLRYGVVHWKPIDIPPRSKFESTPILKEGPLLRTV